MGTSGPKQLHVQLLPAAGNTLRLHTQGGKKINKSDFAKNSQASLSGRAEPCREQETSMQMYSWNKKHPLEQATKQYN